LTLIIFANIGKALSAPAQSSAFCCYEGKMPQKCQTALIERDICWNNNIL